MGLSYISSTHKVSELWKAIAWELGEHCLQRTVKNKTSSYSYASIEAIRLCFHMGGRGIPARYCCYLKVDGEWSDQLIFSSPSGDIGTVDYQNYHAFTLALMQEVKRTGRLLIIQTGHSALSWSMYLFFCSLFPMLPYFLYSKQIISYKELIWITIILAILCIPMLLSMYKFFPRRLAKDQQIPASVLPNPIYRP